MSQDIEIMEDVLQSSLRYAASAGVSHPVSRVASVSVMSVVEDRYHKLKSKLINGQ